MFALRPRGAASDLQGLRQPEGVLASERATRTGNARAPAETVVGRATSISLPAGRHVLRFEFDPVWFRLGAGVSTAGAIALLIQLARRLRTREHRS